VQQYRLDKAAATTGAETLLWEDGPKGVIEQIRAATNGRGADVCIEAVGFEPDRNMLEKAKALDKKIEEETDKVDANRDGWADTTVKDKLKEHESTLKGKDDFFERASRYAEGDYSMGKPVVTKKDDTTEEGMTELPPLPKKDDFADDAIIDDEEDPKKT
jgi:hypothetical protein